MRRWLGGSLLDQDELLRVVVSVLEELHLPYFITGSMATIFFGEPRFTNDVDVVVDLPGDRVAELCSAFSPEEFYLSQEAALQAVARHGQFNVIHPTSGQKVDFMVAERTPFNRSRFARIKRVKPAPDYEASFASPEDVILKKMEYFRDGASEKHLRDIAGVLVVSGDELDHAYLEDWACRLGLEEIWRAILARLDGRTPPPLPHPLSPP